MNYPIGGLPIVDGALRANHPWLSVQRKEIKQKHESLNSESQENEIIQQMSNRNFENEQKDPPLSRKVNRVAIPPSAFSSPQIDYWPFSLKLANLEIDRAIRASNFQEAMRIFKKIKAKFIPDIFSYNLMIRLYVKLGNKKEVIETLAEIERNNLKPNDSTYSTLLRLFMEKGDEQEVREILVSLEKNGFTQCDTHHTVLSFLAEKGDERAKEVLIRMYKEGIGRESSHYEQFLESYEEGQEILATMIENGAKLSQEVSHDTPGEISYAVESEKEILTILQESANEVKLREKTYPPSDEGAKLILKIYKNDADEITHKLILAKSSAFKIKRVPRKLIDNWNWRRKNGIEPNPLPQIES